MPHMTQVLFCILCREQVMEHLGLWSLVCEHVFFETLEIRWKEDETQSSDITKAAGQTVFGPAYHVK